MVVVEGLFCGSLGLDLALQSAGGPGAHSGDVRPGLQGICFAQAQSRSAPDTTPLLIQESSSE